MHNLIKQTNPQWHDVLFKALACMDPNYLLALQTRQTWLPGLKNLFAAFQQKQDIVKYILLGESPYPRLASANGYAFWDAAVQSLWSPNGLSKAVNRATSLRNFIKMLLCVRGDLREDFSQNAIAKLDKSGYQQTAHALFTRMIDQGFLLLNASLVYEAGEVLTHARQWRPFLQSLFEQLAQSSIQLVLLGKIASLVPQSSLQNALVAEHPYNLSFITNPKVMSFFKPMDLLSKPTSSYHYNALKIVSERTLPVPQ